MKIVFHYSDKARERILADAFAAGAKTHGDDVELRALTPEKEVIDCDVAVMVGVKSRELYEAHWKAGVHVLMVDKGYIRARVDSPVRQWEYWRLSLDAHHPTRWLSRMQKPGDRWARFGLQFQPWREQGQHVLFAGSSEKYHNFYGLPHPTEYAKRTVKHLRKTTDRRIVYRPKPTWREAVPVKGADFSKPPEYITGALQNAHAMVTHGSNACFEAILAGVPCIVLGDAVAKPISSTEIADVEQPRLASDAERQQWFANLAYLQWNLREMASGEAWQHMRGFVYG